jgi:hypothetical protein
LGAGPISLMFNSSTWNSSACLTLDSDEDMVAEPTRYFRVYCYVESIDFHYSSYGSLCADVSLVDNDLASFRVSHISLSEPNSDSLWAAANDDAVLYNVSLTSQPLFPVAVVLSVSSDGLVPADEDVVYIPHRIYFNLSAWNVTQVVSISAVDDNIDEGDVYTVRLTHTADTVDPTYAGSVSTVDASILDNDEAGLLLSRNTLTITEGRDSRISYSMQLQSQPTRDVAIQVKPGDGVVVTPTLVIFTQHTWGQPATIEVTAVDDFVARGHGFAIIKHIVQSGDFFYLSTALQLSDIHVTIKDNDVAGVKFSATAVQSTESAASSYEVWLSSQPAAGVVTVTIDSMDDPDSLQFSVNPSTLVFYPTNWRTHQRVDLFPTLDILDEGANTTFMVANFIASTADPGYQSTVVNITFTIIDDDVAPMPTRFQLLSPRGGPIHGGTAISLSPMGMDSPLEQSMFHQFVASSSVRLLCRFNRSSSIVAELSAQSFDSGKRLQCRTPAIQQGVPANMQRAESILVSLKIADRPWIAADSTFTYHANFATIAIDPVVGPASGGTLVSLQGQGGWSDSVKCSFGGTLSVDGWLRDGKIYCTTPPIASNTTQASILNNVSVAVSLNGQQFEVRVVL